MPRANAHTNWAKAAPRRRRVRWHRRPHRADNVANGAGLDDPAWAASTAVVRIAEVVEPLPPQYEQKLMWRSRQLMRAARLWAPDYKIELEREKGEAPELWEHVTNLYKDQVSTYRLRLKDERQLLRYDAKTERMVRDQVAVMRRRRNHCDIPFSVDARTGSYYNQRMPERIWRDNQKCLRICHRDTALSVLETMMEVEPPPGFIVNTSVAAFGVDQCNHCGRARRRRKRASSAAQRGSTARACPCTFDRRL